jgi:BirA family transcriptional regulator, biotin operon repressor / biotin---[acetyl-CoA-carboxylase] ligase
VEEGPNERFDQRTIQEGLRTRWLGRDLYFYPAIGSTNDEGKRLAADGTPEGTVLVADEQTAGRGRLQRRWMAPPGSSLLLSVILRPRVAPAQIQRVTMICGLAAADALIEVAGVVPDLKWPNDLLLQGRKVTGILTEMATIDMQVDYVVVGIGINVNIEPAYWAGPDDKDDSLWGVALAQDQSLIALAGEATSVAAAAGRPVSRLRLLWRLLEGIEARYERLRAGDSPHEEWSARLAVVGREVEVSTGSEVLIGRVAGVDADGALLLDTAAGRRRVLAGDLKLRERGVG